MSESRGATSDSMADLERWIENQLESGYSPEQLKESLKKSGIDPGLVDETLGKSKKMGRSPLFYSIVGAVLLAAGVVFLILVRYPRDFDDVHIRREIRSPSVVGTDPNVTLRIENGAGGLTIKEEIPPDLGVACSGGGDVVDGSIVWRLGEGEDEVEYWLSAKRAPVGDYVLNGTYSSWFKEAEVEGEKNLRLVL